MHGFQVFFFLAPKYTFLKILVFYELGMCGRCPCGWGLEFKDCGFALGGVCVGEDIEDVAGGLDCHSRSRSLGSMWEDLQSKESFHFSPSRGQFCTGTNQGVHLGVYLLGIAAFLLLQQLHCFRNV